MGWDAKCGKGLSNKEPRLPDLRQQEDLKTDISQIVYNQYNVESCMFIHQPKCVYIQRNQHTLARNRKYMSSLNPLNIGVYIYPNPNTPPQVGNEGVRMPNLDSK